MRSIILRSIVENQVPIGQSGPASAFQRLNRKIHIYAGMFSILFIVFFGLSGFILNHRWKLWEWFPSRVETTREIAVQIPADGADLQKARAILKQINIDGELQRIVSEPTKQSFSFDVQRPGQTANVKLDTVSGKGTLKTTDLNAWSILHIMHIFSGHGDKNWKWANVWKFFSDLTAIIMVILAVSGFYMWLNLKTARRWGLIFLEIGAVVFFLLVWLLSKFNF
ncbi:MAG: PepSY-associated TM helix domain-containing protein [Verrucomicrobia bacterium]|nr:PepSY-associated TM helix domain-containing protein [Verrucomicrobiota bacterium]